jgi:replicative DNA helicase|tara:strand:- start:14716 stop:16197 length:1482 start_codon:yes stop_codon:yes gene_type:complete
MAIYSLQVEKHLLGGLIKHPYVFPDVDQFVNENDFYNSIHQTIFCVIRDSVLGKEKIDVVLLSQKIKNLGVSFKDDINVFDYIESISHTQINKQGIIESAKELVKLRILREIEGTSEKLKRFAATSSNEDIDSIISESDRIYGEKISSYELNDRPENLFDGIDDLVEARGNEPDSESGISTTYPEFNRMYGGLREGNIYAIVSRPAQGKTTWINDICFKTALKHDIPALILDTEMSREEMQFRMASSISGVPMWYIETGNWRKNKDMVDKVREALDKMKDYNYMHYHVGNKNIDQICSIVRRWYYSKVGRGNRCIIAYDYVKLTGEKVDRNWAEHQAIGEKIDKLKKLAEEVNAPIITAMQMNRSGETHNRRGSDITDDSSAIALSDRLQWFAAFVAIFRRKTIDEMALDGERFGSHKLIPLKTRFQGKDAAGHHDLVKRTFEDGSEKYVNNYLNFSVNNFSILEHGSLVDVVEAASEQYELNDQRQNDGELL